MAELLKHRYSKAYVARLAAALVEADPRIDASAFVRAVLGRGWSGLELKQRMRRIAECLHAHVPGDYRAQLATLQRAAPGFGGFEGMFFPDFVERYGLDDFDASIEALAELTRYSSSEFAVRPFIVRSATACCACSRAGRGTKTNTCAVSPPRAVGRGCRGACACRGSSPILRRCWRSSSG